MKKVSTLLMMLVAFCGIAWAQEGVPTTITPVLKNPADITTGYYLLKQVNNNKDCAGGERGVGYIKYNTETVGTKATPVGTDANPTAANYVWYVEVNNDANKTITISTVNKVASWHLPSKATHVKPLVAYAQKTKLIRVTGAPNPPLGSATAEAPKENSCYLTNEQKDSYVHFSGTELGSWTSSGANSTFMVQFYALEGENANNYAKRELQKAIDDATPYIPYVGTGMNKYTQGEGQALKTLVADAKEGLKNGDAATNFALEREVNKAVNSLTINQPVVGHFYAIKGKLNKKYMDGTEMKAKINTTDKVRDNFSAGQIFYLNTDKKLLNYAQGYHMSGTHTLNATDVANTWTFHASKGNKIGYYTLQSNFSGGGQYLYDNKSGNNTFCDRNSNYKADNCDWQIEEVTTLPVTVTEAGWATLYAPVALTIPADVKVYTGKVNVNKLTLTQVKTTIPANTPVLIEANANTYNFNINYEATATSTIDQSLTGTIETKAKPTETTTTIFTLQKHATAGLGFFKYKGDNLQGFRAYGENLLGTNTAAAGLVFDFGSVTGIEGATTDNGEKAEIYDLSGRRVAKAQKGIYIINGKKVIIK